MKDLTIPRWIKLARKLAKRERLWNKFVNFMYMGEDEETPQLAYDDDDVGVDVDADAGAENWQEEDWGADEGEGEDDADEDGWEAPQEGQWSLPTDLRKGEDDILP